ncbi:LuxR C-terminal-related transcriptional regulator [Lentzea nigeriaca]|uniref:LuxR C-terminal-related transcriptional regulator n=1 Tax=Lentzea nigeriaca TaxID=1128665 RepID=UPI003558F63A
MKLAAIGRTNAEIARELFISVGMVKTHLVSVQATLDARHRAAGAGEAAVRQRPRRSVVHGNR